MPPCSSPGDDERQLRISIKRIFLAPIEESLPESERGEHNRGLLLDKYIKPFMSQHPDLVIRRGLAAMVNGSMKS